MTLPNVAGYCVATAVMFGLVEAAMLGMLMTSDSMGAACGGRLLRGRRGLPGHLHQKLETLGFFFGHVFVGVVTPYAVVALLIPRPDWLSRLAGTMILASGGFAASAILAAFLAGLLATRVAAPGPEHRGPYRISDVSHCLHRVGTPREAA